MALHGKVGSSIEELIVRYTEIAMKEATEGKTKTARNRMLHCLLLFKNLRFASKL